MQSTIAIVGRGRLGPALAAAFDATGRRVLGPFGRGADGAGADVVLLCVPDAQIGAAIADSLSAPEFRGCAFLNAAAEFPDPTHPVHQAVLDHRQWFLTTMTELFTATGKPDPTPAAQHFVMLRDGAMAAGCLTDPKPICETYLRGIEGLLGYRSRQGADS